MGSRMPSPSTDRLLILDVEHIELHHLSNVASNFNLMHNISMRTTVTLDDDAYELAMLCAKGKGITLGAAISEFVRKGQEARLADKSPSPGLIRGPKGTLMFAPQGRVITNEMVKAALEESGD
jgi:hypothetical protein